MSCALAQSPSAMHSTISLHTHNIKQRTYTPCRHLTTTSQAALGCRDKRGNAGVRNAAGNSKLGYQQVCMSARGDDWPSFWWTADNRYNSDIIPRIEMHFHRLVTRKSSYCTCSILSGPSSTSTEVTFANGGPCLHQACNSPIFSALPCAQSWTLPSSALRTQPTTPSLCASSRVETLRTQP